MDKWETVEDVVNELTKLLNLDANDSDMLLHDINNLRGDEWLDVIKKECSEEILKKYKMFIF